jgi:hypothetical protein
LNPDDFSEAFWMTPLELQQRIVQGEAVKGDLEEILERIYKPKT